MAKNRMELIESWMASAETPAAVYDDERNEREREKTKPVSYSFTFFLSFVCLRSSATRDERTDENSFLFFLFLNLPLLFSASKKTKTLSSSSSFSPCFCSPFFPSLFARKHFQQHTMDNKSEILEQKKQSETPLASARANAEQR